MSVPSVFLGLLIASICGLFFHLIRGGGISRLGLYLLTAWIAFFAGHLVGIWLRWDFLRLGMLNLFPALLATVVGLVSASILAGPEHSSIRHRGRRRPPSNK